jgi:hypothetical protein
LYPKRTAGILANGGRFVVRRKANRLDFPVQTHPHGSFGFFRSRLMRLLRELLKAIPLAFVRRENMGIAKSGQGGFLAVF